MGCFWLKSWEEGRAIRKLPQVCHGFSHHDLVILPLGPGLELVAANSVRQSFFGVDDLTKNNINQGSTKTIHSHPYFFLGSDEKYPSESDFFRPELCKSVALPELFV